jgi:hypothetical protein
VSPFDTYHKFYEKVYEKRDNPRGDSHGWIQWKGTEICIDLHCVCGHHAHFDGDFFYFYECSSCHRKFAVGQNVKLIELTKKEIALGNILPERFKSPTG